MRRTVILLCLAIFVIADLSAQNLIPNPSVESTSPCPTSAGQINYAASWASYAASPDYYHSCGSGNYTTPGPNLGGSQVPADGNAYFAAVSKYSTSSYREYAGCMLPAPLVVGQSYDFSMQVSLTDISQYGSDRFGMVLTTGPSVTTGNFAHVYATSVISDRNNWTTISGTFTATQPYTYLFIGNFYDDANTTLTFFAGGGFYAGAYYYADDFSLTTTVVLPSEKLELAHLENQGPKVLLGWEKPEGEDVVKYLLERSLDNGENYEEIAVIEDDPREVLRYSDQPGRYHVPILYRLRSVDVNGHTQLSNLVNTTLEPGTALNLDLYPSPVAAGENLTIRFDPVRTGAHKIEIMDLPGRQVWEHTVTADEIGMGVQFNTGQLAAGTYLVRLTSGNTTEVKKFSITN